MTAENFEQKRLKDLESSLDEDRQLLKELEDTLRYEENPKTIAKYRRQKQQLLESIDNNQKEYKQLQTKVAAVTTAENIAQTKNNTLEKQIFISYAWGSESEEIVNKIDESFQQRGITIVRDKRDAGFKANIKEFMKSIGRGKCVITIISEKYLKSPNCMFELVEIAKNGNFYDRIFPIVLKDAQIYDPLLRIEYITHWEEKIQKLEAAMKKVSSANMGGFREDIDLYTEIRSTIAELTNTLRQMNALTPELHTSSGFEQLYQAIEKKLNQS